MANVTDTIVENVISSEDIVDSDEEGASAIVWIGLIFCAVVSFWFQATITEERFVPALNVIATRFNIPDDVAGATLMAAGASSPELFSSIVALFVTHSALGLGTIVGSEIFNQLMICCGSIYAARGHRLELNRAIVTREVGFYALSIILLYIALRDREPAMDDDATGTDHIYISFLDACLLFGGYILYVLVCSNFDAVLKLVGKIMGGGGASDGEVTPLKSNKRIMTNIAIPSLPYLRQVKNEPKNNFDHESPQQQQSGGDGSTPVGMYTPHEAHHAGDSLRNSIIQNVRKSVMGVSSISRYTFQIFNMHDEKPSERHELTSMETNEYEERLSCFLWQRSRFYTKARARAHGWHLRWCTFSHEKMISVPDRADHDKHLYTYPPFETIEVDEDHLILKLTSEGGRAYIFMAPSIKILEQVVSKCEEIMEVNHNEKSAKQPAFVDIAPAEDSSPLENEEPSLIDYPVGASYPTLLAHFILYPFKLAMHLTVPDVRHYATPPLSTALIATTSCLLWLIVGSYAMVASLESLADLMSIPPAVVGVTVSAVGTSLPNYVGSQVAAKQGLGNMAVSNAFGSNTFNILVGLGLPWVLYIGLGSEEGPYHGLRDDGITESVIILAVVLVAFVVLLVMSNFVLYKWHANVFALMYLVFLIYSVAPYVVG